MRISVTLDTSNPFHTLRDQVGHIFQCAYPDLVEVRINKKKGVMKEVLKVQHEGLEEEDEVDPNQMPEEKVFSFVILSTRKTSEAKHWEVFHASLKQVRVVVSHPGGFPRIDFHVRRARRRARSYRSLGTGWNWYVLC